MPSIQELFALDGRVAIVTGGSRGLGEEMAEGLAEAGAALMICARRDEWLTPTLERFTARGFRVEGLGGRRLEAGRRAGRRRQDDGGLRPPRHSREQRRRHVGRRPEDMPLDKWQKVIDVNLTGAFLFAQAAGREMLKREYGRIVNISSIAGLHAAVHGPHYAAYAASKAGLMGLTRELAASWGRHNIRVNAIAPGFFHSRLADPVLPLVEPAIKATSPIPRVGAEGELKGVCLFLVSDASNYITGQTIVVDGGRTIGGS